MTGCGIKCCLAGLCLGVALMILLVFAYSVSVKRLTQPSKVIFMKDIRNGDPMANHMAPGVQRQRGDLSHRGMGYAGDAPRGYGGYRDPRVRQELMDCGKSEGLIPAEVTNFGDAEAAFEKRMVGSSLDSPCVFPCATGSLRFLDKAIKCASLGKDNRVCCQQKGVSDKCKPLCDGTTPVSHSMNSLYLAELLPCGYYYFWQVADCHLDNR